MRLFKISHKKFEFLNYRRRRLFQHMCNGTFGQDTSMNESHSSQTNVLNPYV